MAQMAQIAPGQGQGLPSLTTAGPSRALLRSWAAVLLLLGGCQPRASEFAEALARVPPGPMIPLLYAPQLSAAERQAALEQFDRRLQPLDRLWSRAQFRVDWRDEAGWHREEADEGNFISVLPEQVALRLGKLGETFIWAGCDAKRYWVFDLLPGRPRRVYHGSRGAAAEAHPRLPAMPIRPDHLPDLLGLLPLGDFAALDGTSLERLNGYVLVQPASADFRVLIDPLTGLPVRVDRLDARGVSRLVCHLSDYRPVAIEGLPDADGPRVATRVEVFVLDPPVRIRLHLTDLSDGRADNRIKPAVFSLEFLMDQYFRIPLEGRLNLDPPGAAPPPDAAQR